jgi:hypothetical protein
MTDSIFEPDPEIAADEQPAYCPFCGHDGAFDAQAKDYSVAKLNRLGSNTTWHQEWYHSRCPECGGHFKTLEEAWMGESE